MRIAECRKISTRTEHRIIHHDAEYDDDGNITAEAFDETIEVEIPVIGMVYRDATTDEIAEMEYQQSQMPEPEPTPDERMEAQVLYTALMTDTLLEG